MVDGLDVFNGQLGSLKNCGYVLELGESLVIEGFCKNEWEVVVFCFVSFDDVYVSNSVVGDSCNFGVIGVVLFELDVLVSGCEVLVDGLQVFFVDVWNGGGYVLLLCYCD